MAQRGLLPVKIGSKVLSQEYSGLPTAPSYQAGVAQAMVVAEGVLLPLAMVLPQAVAAQVPAAQTLLHWKSLH